MISGGPLWLKMRLCFGYNKKIIEKKSGYRSENDHEKKEKPGEKQS